MLESPFRKSSGVVCPKCGRWISIMTMEGITEARATCGCGLIVCVEFFEDMRSIMERSAKRLEKRDTRG